jgi:hypothetical protein
LAPIDSVVALESQEINIGKTSLLVGTGIATWALLIIIVEPVLLLEAAAP